MDNIQKEVLFTTVYNTIMHVSAIRHYCTVWFSRNVAGDTPPAYRERRNLERKMRSQHFDSEYVLTPSADKQLHEIAEADYSR